MTSFNLLTPPTTPPTTPDGKELKFPECLDLIIFDQYQDIEIRGTKTIDGIKVKVSNLLTKFKLNISYMRTVTPYLVAYTLRELYTQDFCNITESELFDQQEIFSEYENSYELYIKYKGIEVLAHNVPDIMPFKDWLDTVIDTMDLHCHENIDYDKLNW
jgi:hypothetical protein